MEQVINYVADNAEVLFRHVNDNSQVALFDSKGFFFSEAAKLRYDNIKYTPHLYVAWSVNDSGHYYIGKSYQKGGRWQRQHAYHLGTLAHHLLDTIDQYDQNHLHWITNWFVPNSVTNIGLNQYSVELMHEVRIAFIPFNVYHEVDFTLLSKEDIRAVNTSFERALIAHYLSNNKVLLNVHHNRINFI